MMGDDLMDGVDARHTGGVMTMMKRMIEDGLFYSCCLVCATLPS